MTSQSSEAASHAAEIAFQFTAQAADFAAAPELHNAGAIAALVNAASPRATDTALDVACGPGSVAVGLARHVRHVIGLDATAAMLGEARKLSAREGITNITWQAGDAAALPFAAESFDVVSCRFAFHHMLEPAKVFTQMLRVLRPGGRLVLCDGVAPDDPVKAEAFNRMERFRDPSTVAFRTLGMLKGLFAESGLPEPSLATYRVPYEIEDFVARSHPAGDDRAGLLTLLADSLNGDKLGMGTRREDGRVYVSFNAVILAAVKGR